MLDSPLVPVVSPPVGSTVVVPELVEPLELVTGPVEPVAVVVEPSLVDEPSLVGPDGPPLIVIEVAESPVASPSLLPLPLEQAPTSTTPQSQSPSLKLGLKHPI